MPDGPVPRWPAHRASACRTRAGAGEGTRRGAARARLRWCPGGAGRRAGIAVAGGHRRRGRSPWSGAGVAPGDVVAGEPGARWSHPARPARWRERSSAMGAGSAWERPPTAGAAKGGETVAHW